MFRNVWIIVCVSVIGFVLGCSKATRLPSEALSVTTEDIIEEKWGIRVEGIRHSAAGYILDFRYRILDPEKASRLITRKNKPYLIDEATGIVCEVPNPPKVGPLRQTSVQPKSDVVYFILFANPGKRIQTGDKVTVVIGDLRVEGLVVQ
jgi:hypothetical protein